MFPVLYSPNETVPLFSRLFYLLDPDPGGISLSGSVSETLVLIVTCLLTHHVILFFRFAQLAQKMAQH